MNKNSKNKDYEINKNRNRYAQTNREQKHSKICKNSNELKLLSNKLSTTCEQKQNKLKQI
jgi:hypothetical protein